MNSDETNVPAWEPTVSLVISGVTALAGAAGLVAGGWSMTGPRQGGLENLGGFVLMMLAMGGTLAASVTGMIAASIGLKRSKNRGVRTPSDDAATSA